MKQPEHEGGILELRPYTIGEMAELYKVSRLTFRRWVHPFREEIGKRNGHFYTIKQVKIIIEHLGAPELLRIDKDL